MWCTAEDSYLSRICPVPSHIYTYIICVYMFTPNPIHLSFSCFPLDTLAVKHVLRKLQQQYPFLNITEEQLVDYQNVSEFGEHKVALDLGKGILGIKEQPFVYSAPTNVLNKGDSYECLVNITVNVTEPPQEKKSLLDDEDEEDDM